MTNKSRDIILELVQARQNLANAQAQVAALEAAVSPTDYRPSKLSLFSKLLKQFDLRVSVGYAIIASCWIVFSDQILARMMSQDLSLSATYSVIKGLVFVWLTAIALFSLLHAELRKRGLIEAALEHDLIRRQQAEENITKLNRTLGVLSDINQTIIRTRHIPTLYENACNIAVEKGAFRMAWIGLLDSKTQRIIPVAHAGFTDDYLEKLNIALNDEVRGYGPTGKAIRSGQHVIVSDIEHDPMMQPWRDDARRLNYGSLAALPLTVAGEVRGALNLYASESHFFDDAEFRVVDEMAGDISFAMEFAEQDVQRKQTEATLLESERRYHRMLDDLLEGAEIIGFDWRYLYVNEASASHGRMSKEVLLKGTVLELYPGIENTDLFACLRTCMEDRTPQHFENEFVFPDGATTWFELSVQPVPEGIFILSLDITERKRSEIALQRYTKRMEILYEIDNGLIQGTSVKALIQATLIHLSQLIPCQQANVTLIDPITGEGQTFAHDLSHDSFFTEGVPFTLPDNIYGRDDDKHVQIFDDIRPFQDSSPRVKQLVGEGWVSLLRAALTDQDNPLGSLVLVADTPHYFDTEYQEIAAQVAGQLAIAIRQFQLSAELYKSETRYRRVVEDQTDLICRYNSDYTLTFVNEAYASIYNKRAGELIGMNFFELMAEADRAYSKVYLSTLSASNPVASTEHRSLLPDGTERWIQWTDRALLDSAGNITEYQGVGRDITDRKRAEEAVNRQNAILHQSRDLIALSDLEGRISYINASGAALMGFQSAQAAYGTVISDYYTPDDMHCIVTRYLPEALETGNWRGENRLKTITGSLIDVDQTIFPIRDDMGNLQYYATIMVDITGRKQAEETLRKSEARQRAMLTAIPDIMFRYRGDGTFLEYHAPHAELLATPPEIFLGKKTTEVLPLELAESLLNRIKHVVETKEPVQMEYTLEVPSGMREFESRMVSVGEDEVLAIVRDVTERKLAERELQSLYNATSYLFKADSLLGLGRQIVAAVIREFEHVDCGIMLLDKSKSNILRLARTGRSDIHPDIPLQLNGPGLVPMALRTGEVVYVPDVTQNTHYVSSEDTTQTEFVIPLKTTNGIIGALDMQHTRKDAFSDRDRRILTAYAERAAPAIEIMQLYDELNRHAADLEWRVAQRTVELNYAKERAEAILNHSADGIILLDSNMIIEQTNLAFNDIFAAPDDAYFGRPFTDLLVDEEKERINQIFLKGNLDKKGQRLETRARRKDGTAFDAELGIGFIKKRGQVCIIRDITDRKQAEKAIAEERNLLRTLIDALPDYIYVKDTNHKTLLSNLARTHSFGLESPEETIGKDDYDFVPAELVAQYHIDEDRLFQTLEPLIDHEERGVGLTGDLIWASTTKVPLHNLNGELIGLVGVTRDISDRKLREQQLRFDAGIQASVSDAVIVTDMDFRIQSWNKAAVSIYGWTTNEVLGKSIVEILRTRFESAEAENHDRVLLFSEHQLQGEFMQQRKDGTELYTQSSTTVFKDESGIPIGIISVNRDITERKKAEQALRESEIRFRSLFASAPIATVITDQQGQITLINQQAENVFGYSAQELIGRPIEILLPAQVRDYHPILRASYIADPRIRGMGPLKELNALRKDGAEFPVEIGLSYVETTDGLLVMSFIMDITERKKAEQALRDSETRFGLLVNGVRDYAIYLVNPEGNVVTWNQGAERIKGYSADEIIGQNVARFYTPEDIARGEPERTFKIAAAEGHFTAEGERIRKDGTRFWAEVAVTALADNSGHLVGYAKVIRDLTENRKAQETLRLSEERYRLLAENISDIISRVTPDGIYIDVSPSSKSVLGYTPEEMIGKSGSYFIHPDDIATVTHNREESLKRLIETPLSYRFRHRNGHYIWLEVARKFVMSQETNTIKEYVTSSRDITVRKRAEEALRNALEKEKELSELKSRFVSMASHEFRTPLATILATAETLSAYRSKLSENQIQEKLDKISDQIGYLKSIIEDTMQVARLQDPKVNFERVDVDVDAVCRSVIDEFESRPDVTQQFIYTHDASLQQARLDGKLIRQMINNLLSNAVKYSAPNTTVRVTLEHMDGALMLKVQDEGIGIPEDDLKHLFEPFHRATNVGMISGTGLGLVITKESVELHGGFITVDSKVGVGTTFTIMIPLQ